MAYLKHTLAALDALDNASMPVITKWIKSELPEVNFKPHLLKAAIKKAVDSGQLIQSKATYSRGAIPAKGAPKGGDAPSGDMDCDDSPRISTDPPLTQKLKGACVHEDFAYLANQAGRTSYVIVRPSVPPAHAPRVDSRLPSIWSG